MLRSTAYEDLVDYEYPTLTPLTIPLVELVPLSVYPLNQLIIIGEALIGEDEVVVLGQMCGMLKMR